MNRQAVFTQVRDHLLRQGERSWGDTGSVTGASTGCLYRGPDGLKCAIGCLISDEHYSRRIEFKSPASSLIREAVGLSLGCKISHDDASFLIKLQWLHDDVDPKDWSSELIAFAAARERITWTDFKPDAQTS